MVRKVITTIAMAAIALTQSPVNASTRNPTPTAQANLSASTREDILAGYEILKAHHPGMYNPFEPNFPAKLARARDKALDAASHVYTEEDRVLAVEIINKSLADGHSRINVSYNGNFGEWPDFYAAWRGDGLYITSSSKEGPARGSVLISCDGKSAHDLILEIAFQMFGREKEAGQWWLQAGEVFLRSKLTMTLPLDTCQFRRPDGAIEEKKITWRPYTIQEFKRQMAEHQPLPVGMTIPTEGIYWISLSSFSTDLSNAAAFGDLYKSIDVKIRSLASSRAIVLDLRGNAGGSADWSRGIAEHLWGKPAVSWALAKYFRKTEVWYLADDENIAHFERIENDLRSRHLSELADWADKLKAELARTRRAGKRFYRQPFGRELLAKAKPARPRILPPVYIITDGACASACLDAVDTFTRFKGVRILGAPTSADTTYLEIRRQELPSGRGWVVLPTKLWVNRPRLSGQVYNPDIVIRDLDWTTETMLAHVETDLAAH